MKPLMMKCALVAAMLLVGTASHAEHVKLFLLGGQSNMMGSGTDTSALPTSPVNLQQPQDDVLFYYNQSVGLTTLRPGSSLDFGPEITFGRTVADGMPDESFGLIKYAVSASDLTNDWDPNQSNNAYGGFRSMVAAATTAITNAGNTFEIVGMVWTQGERDARVSPDTYEADLNEFIGDIRTRYGTDLPFFFNQLSDNQTNLPSEGLSKVQAAQQLVADSDPLAYMIDTSTMTFYDDLHFDSESQIALGQAFGDAYLATIPEPGSLAILGLGGLALLRRRRT